MRPLDVDAITGSPARRTHRRSPRLGDQFVGLAGDYQVVLSLGRTGQCWDGVLAESFFASLKGELVDTRPWPTRVAARRAVVEYMGWYNSTRLHSTLGYLSPAEFEATAGKKHLGQVA